MKTLKILLSVVVLFMFTSMSYNEAKTSAESISSEVEALKQLEDVGLEVDINVMSSEEKNYVAEKLRGIGEVEEFHNDITSLDFEKENLNDRDTSKKYTNIENNESVYMVTEAYDNGDELIFTFAQYNDYNDEVSLFYAEKINKYNPEEETVELIHYVNEDENVTAEDESVSTYNFNFNGKSFACSLTGIFACGQWCVMFALVGGPTAAAIASACGVACNVAFAAACSMA